MIYLATPYSKYPAGHPAACHDACIAAAKLILDGKAVYSPIAHTHPVATFGGLDPLDHALWMGLNEHFMRVCDELAVVKMAGWDESKGIAMEIEAFQKAGKPIRYLSWPDLKFEEEA